MKLGKERNLLMGNIASLEVLDITDTCLGTEKIKDLTKNLALPNLHTLQLTESQCMTKFLTLLSKMCGEKFKCLSIPFPIATYSAKISIVESFGLPVLFYSLCQLSHVDLRRVKLRNQVYLLLS